jgi:hypothetical protein
MTASSLTQQDGHERLSLFLGFEFVFGPFRLVELRRGINLAEENSLTMHAKEMKYK